MAIEGREEALGFHLVKRRSRRTRPVVVTDLDFADDIVLLSEEMHQAKELLQRVETSVAKVGLTMNAWKTKFMSCNQKCTVNISTNDGTNLEEVQDFKYVPGWQAQQRTSNNVKQQHGEHAVSFTKSGSLLCQNLLSSDYLLQQLSLCCCMEAKHGPLLPS